MTEIVDSKPIEMEISQIKPDGEVRVEFSERLHSFQDFERYGMNKTYWKDVQNSILEVTYMCNQAPYDAS